MGDCFNCGAELRPGANFCSNCGAAQTSVAPAEAFEPDAAKPAEQASAGRSDGGASAASAAASAPAGQYAAPKKIENHLIKSIIATVCCCGISFGIVGIIYATKAGAFLKQGNRAAAEDAGRKAGLWGNLAIGVGLVYYLLAFMLTVVYQLKSLNLPSL
jgi:hypothetical protein